MKHLTYRLTFPGACAAIVVGMSFSAHATENFVLRYAPGIGGADMSVPLDPGLYMQASLFAYRGKFNISPNVTTIPLANVGAAGATLVGAGYNGNVVNTVSPKLTVDVRALLPRVTYMSAERWLGATIGFTALLPLIEQKISVAVTSATALPSSIVNGTGALPRLPETQQDALKSAVDANALSTATLLAATESGKKWGIGDLEFAPIFRWGSDPDQVVFAPTIILPTGSYDRSRPANPGAGNFYTLRPSLQYSRIGDGWDFGSRISYSWNTKNRDTEYKSGSYLNIDFAVMKSLSDSFRAGLSGYAMQQLTKDSHAGQVTPVGVQSETLSKRSHVVGVGPAFAWIKGAGELMVDGRIVKEFSASNRPKGTALWLAIALPIE